MEIKMGEKIRSLRRGRHLSQEALAEQLGVSFQAVSKWENGQCLPDLALIPGIAMFFGVSTDELFSFNLLERERQVTEIVVQAAEIRNERPAEAEALLRRALLRFPGDEILLNNLLYTLRAPERREECVAVCRSLLDSGPRHDDVKYDVCRILAETYRDMGETALARSALEPIPEIYFTRLELEAELLAGEESLDAARRQKNLSADLLVRMLRRIAELTGAEEDRRCVERILEALGDFPAPFERGPLTLRDVYGAQAG